MGVCSGVKLLMEQTNDFGRWPPLILQQTVGSGLTSGDVAPQSEATITKRTPHKLH